MDASTAQAEIWFYEEDGQRKGPLAEDAMVALIRQQLISYGSLVWKAGFPEWLRVEDTPLRVFLEQVAPPPISGRHVNNSVVWLLAFAPIIGLFLEVFFAYAINGTDGGAQAALDNNRYWFITLALNIGVSYWDEIRLERAGYDTSKFKGLTWLVPVYLFKRAKALQQPLGYFIVWIVCFLIALSA